MTDIVVGTYTPWLTAVASLQMFYGPDGKSYKSAAKVTLPFMCVFADVTLLLD